MSHQSKKARAKNRPEMEAVYFNEDTLADQHSNRAYQRIKDLQDAFYGGIDPRRRQEMADGGMIKEDPRAMANLSNKAIHTEYPPHAYYRNPYIDDSLD